MKQIASTSRKSGSRHNTLQMTPQRRDRERQRKQPPVPWLPVQRPQPVNQPRWHLARFLLVRFGVLGRQIDVRVGQVIETTCQQASDPCSRVVNRLDQCFQVVPIRE
jgi:hypothetical protein